MKTLLLFLWTNRRALAALAIKTLEAKLKEEQRQIEGDASFDKIWCAASSSPPPEPVTLTSDELTQHGPMVSIPTEHDTASAILEAKP